MGAKEEANSCIFCDVEHLVGMGSIFTVLYIQYLRAGMGDGWVGWYDNDVTIVFFSKSRFTLGEICQSRCQKSKSRLTIVFWAKIHVSR